MELRRASVAAFKWFTGGWTLQELIAPHVEFRCASSAITKATGISPVVLRMSPAEFKANLCLADICVATITSWAANCQTTRVEVTAYSLCGLLSANMPIMYAEQRLAFHKLQETLIQSVNNHSILVWCACAVSEPEMGGSPKGAAVLQCSYPVSQLRCYRDHPLRADHVTRLRVEDGGTVFLPFLPGYFTLPGLGWFDAEIESEFPVYLALEVKWPAVSSGFLQPLYVKVGACSLCQIRGPEFGLCLLPFSLSPLGVASRIAVMVFFLASLSAVSLPLTPLCALTHPIPTSDLTLDDCESGLEARFHFAIKDSGPRAAAAPCPDPTCPHDKCPTLLCPFVGSLLCKHWAILPADNHYGHGNMSLTTMSISL
ncbi:hypothetical protein DFH27DRAFT_520369 [Peziza echinospora]|nr:hypothetical protein DFH27DRAFT_520369 [Peziza echinospora]